MRANDNTKRGLASLSIVGKVVLIDDITVKIRVVEPTSVTKFGQHAPTTALKTTIEWWDKIRISAQRAVDNDDNEEDGYDSAKYDKTNPTKPFSTVKERHSNGPDVSVSH